MVKDMYMYHVNYQNYEQEICELESRVLFNRELRNKVFYSTVKIDPSISPYIKKRLKIMHQAPSFPYLCELITRQPISQQGFMVQYIPFIKGDPLLKRGRKLSKEIGLRIIGLPSFKSPMITYGITFYDNTWYFGQLVTNRMTWKEHNRKPFSYSSALGINLAKALVNIAADGNKNKPLVDPCCGVGTVLLEAAYSGYSIEGWDIKEKVALNARANIEHFGYPVKVVNGDIKRIKGHFDGAVVDLPYGNFSLTTTASQKDIVLNAMRIASKVVVVASEDMMDYFMAQGIDVREKCMVGKREKGEFYRYIFVIVSGSGV